MRYEGHALDANNPELEKAVEERLKYGVSTTDTWGFDSYLLAVLTNGLEKLAADLHGWPSGEKWPTFEGWREAIENAADDAYWCLVTVVELESEAYNKAYPQTVEDFDSVVEYLESPPVSEEANKIWSNELKKLNAEREMRKDRLFSFVKENLWALWD
jgi:hypothetical protein